MKCAATASLLLAAWSPECADWVEALGAMVDGGGSARERRERGGSAAGTGLRG
ncbi:hypothetical protein PF008_g32840 [Phytophthora fragariae]|uniref:Uncharacterized protein n=1 Tax=Phytophthora fragariae TaxID=53985 RepID=A0A6G0PYU1_9STRA|nr:hypothetical protein PF008_g32840 [Phytophthora fragariae]